MSDFLKRMQKMKLEQKKAEELGEAALYRLFEIAQGDTHQCGVVAKFLLGCYNGSRFKFDLTDFRRLDKALFDDCLLVLKMDWSPKKEVHEYFQEGSKKFENLAKDWRIESND
jgi:hypothetical protein